ncbi:MAG: pyridoxamine 5'-phosphate oxidase [Alphaproteobacteria bacterium]|nr:pyridoxamine 5'-phosphate oxidase [Alphaproteobacteria bacterium]
MELHSAPDLPWTIFECWFALAQQSEPSNPEAMTLATVDADGVPQVRIVLMKDIGQDGVVFFTNSQSTKGQNIAHNPNVALLFYWRSLDRQVCINGVASPIDPAESDRYFASRSRISQIGAWASQQSKPMQDFSVLQAAVAEAEVCYFSADVPRPSHWFGYRVVPNRIEFWIQEIGRLHQRIAYRREDTSQDSWVKQWIFP